MGAGSSTVEREDPWKTIVWETEYDDDGRKKDDEPREEGVFISVTYITSLTRTNYSPPCRNDLEGITKIG